MPTILVVVARLPSLSSLTFAGEVAATAATTEAVRNASVIGSMSIKPRALSWPIGGPCTIVSVSVCVTVHPIGSRTSFAKRASPCSEADPMFDIIQEVPVMAAIARGYVALLASDSML